MSDNRREFIKKSLSLGAMAAAGIGSATSEPVNKETIEMMGDAMLQQPKKKSTLRLVVQAGARDSVNAMTWYKQMGLEDITTWHNNTDPEYYIGTKKHFAAQGINVYGIGNGTVHNQDKLVLNLPGRDAKVEEYKTHLRNLGKAGVGYTTYAHMGNGIWDTSLNTGVTRGGARGRVLDMNDTLHHGRWNELRFEEPLSHGRVYTEDELWENWTYFIKQVAPVAEENNVHIGIHPDDPSGLPIIAGVPRLFSSFERYKKALDIANSPNVGLCLCVGSWMEGGKMTGKSAVEMIEYFGAQKKIWKIHFRNVDQPLPKFTETFVDDGYTNMYTIMKALRKVNFDGVIFPDHYPTMAGGNGNSVAFSVGYIKGLRDRVEAEALAGR